MIPQSRKLLHQETTTSRRIASNRTATSSPTASFLNLVVLEDSEGERFAACAVAQLLEAKHLQTSDMRKEGDGSWPRRTALGVQGGARATYMYVRP